MTTNPDPDKTGCTSASDCPMWDGEGIYIAAKSKQGATVVSDTIPSGTAASCDADSYLGSSPGAVGIAETCRLARMSPLSGR